MAFGVRSRRTVLDRLGAEGAPSLLELREDFAPEVSVSLAQPAVPFRRLAVAVSNMLLLAGVALVYALVAHLDNEKKVGLGERCSCAFHHDSTPPSALIA
jgi:hypothetical protein